MSGTRHLASAAIKDIVLGKREPKPVLDDTNTAEEEQPVLDGADQETEEVLDSAGEYAQHDIALSAVAAIHEFAETAAEDLGEGEGLGDRLFGLLVGIADQDMDGEINSDSAEAEIIQLAAEAAADYLISKGVPESDAIELLSEFDNDQATNVQELLISALPDGEDAALEEMDAFVFGADESVLDAVYKKKWAVRKGKKVRINKRISGKVRLSAKQKLAIKKAVRKAFTATAKMRRAKSVKIRQRAGL